MRSCYAKSKSLNGHWIAAFHRLGIGELVAFSPMNVLVIETANEHQKVFAIDFRRGPVAGDRGHLKGSLLEPAVPDRQPIAVPVKHLEFIASAIDEEEQMT